MDRVLIVGAGQAAVATAEALRAGGHAGTITVLGDEPHGPYHRPPLSKGWLAGEMQAAQLVMRAPEVLAKKGIVLRAGVTVSAIDRTARCVHLADGAREPYDALVLATGATPRRLPGFEQAAVLRGRDDAEALAARLQALKAAGRPLTVVGGGFIGLEVAATARKLGLAVTVIEAQPRLLARALPSLLSDWFAALHRAHGVDLRLGASVDGVDPAEALLGIGVVPDDALARAAGLACDGGIVVDAHGRTSDPAIVAAGDCTVRRLPDGRLLRLESVQGATEGGKAAAATLLGQDRPFTATPWFWSDQYGRKLQMAGLSAGADRSVLRGVLDAPSFSAWHFAGERLIAVDSVDDAKAHLLARRLLDAGRSPTPAQAADLAFDLATLLT
ncbi:MAG: FAD-dependent oxidoreductase [Burkholderiaceae bacterium]|nr:FAD-dependent oxidoreductase [Burkholderiaceae bacterium]